MPPTEFVSICSIMGITSVLSVPTPPAVPTAGTTTIFAKEDDKNEGADIAELMTFYKGLLMNGTMNWETKEPKNLQEPAFTQAFTNAIKDSSISARAESLKTPWGAIINPGKSHELGSAGPTAILLCHT